MGQNTALKTRRLKEGGPTTKKGGEKIRLKAQKEDFNKKSCTKHQKGRKYIYICKNIYEEENIRMYIKGLYLTLGVLPTFSET